MDPLSSLGYSMRVGYQHRNKPWRLEQQPANRLFKAAAEPRDLTDLSPCCCVVLVLQRYDPVTTGIGSLLVTGYCVVAHNQSVGEALNIAACATVLGMVSHPFKQAALDNASCVEAGGSVRCSKLCICSRPQPMSFQSLPRHPRISSCGGTWAL